MTEKKEKLDLSLLKEINHAVRSRYTSKSNQQFLTSIVEYSNLDKTNVALATESSGYLRIRAHVVLPNLLILIEICPFLVSIHY